MQNVNLAIVMGNLTRDPELRYTPNGQPVTSFGVATNRSWKDANGEKKDEVEFHEVVVWGKLAELCSQYLNKGRKVHVMGRLQTRSWEGQDGAKRQKTEIVAQDIAFVDSRRDGNDFDMGEEAAAKKNETKKAKKSSGKTDKPEEEEINIDDIPF
ncbi:single-stranded DNA-binding protein [candidate division WS5 bacterium]|uniref:Single-stranded DNA-binding protein n=1 Tax=candidate division WS5 bacterium TaxID=2093353 RepID=A0A419DEK3_9BACT|nr:MAG: single-stranded DNA-binding protein [candidate division WS5 bacterium]